MESRINCLISFGSADLDSLFSTAMMASVCKQEALSTSHQMDKRNNTRSAEMINSMLHVPGRFQEGAPTGLEGIRTCNPTETAAYRECGVREYSCMHSGRHTGSAMAIRKSDACRAAG